MTENPIAAPARLDDDEGGTLHVYPWLSGRVSLVARDGDQRVEFGPVERHVLLDAIREVAGEIDDKPAPVPSVTPTAEDFAAAVLPIIAAELRAAKAEAILMDGFDMAVADRLADAGYTEYAEDEDGGVTWVSAPLGEVLHIVRTCATEYETGDQA